MISLEKVCKRSIKLAAAGFFRALEDVGRKNLEKLAGLGLRRLARIGPSFSPGICWNPSRVNKGGKSMKKINKAGETSTNLTAGGPMWWEKGSWTGWWRRRAAPDEAASVNVLRLRSNNCAAARGCMHIQWLGFRDHSSGLWMVQRPDGSGRHLDH